MPVWSARFHVLSLPKAYSLLLIDKCLMDYNIIISSRYYED